MEEVAAQLKEGKQQKQLERIDDVVDQLRDCDVEAQQHGEPQAKNGRRAEHGIDADQQAQGDAPRKPPGRCAAPQKSKDRQRNPSIEKSVTLQR